MGSSLVSGEGRVATAVLEVSGSGEYCMGCELQGIGGNGH